MGRKISCQIAEIVGDDRDASRFESRFDALNRCQRIWQMLKNLKGENNVILAIQGRLMVVNGIDTLFPDAIMLETFYSKIKSFAERYLVIIKSQSGICQEQGIVARAISVH